MNDSGTSVRADAPRFLPGRDGSFGLLRDPRLAASDAGFLEELKTARDAIVAAIAGGRTTVDYMIRGRRHVNEAPTEALLRIEELIDIYERKAARSGRSTFRLARLQRPRGTC